MFLFIALTIRVMDVTLDFLFRCYIIELFVLKVQLLLSFLIVNETYYFEVFHNLCQYNLYYVSNLLQPILHYQDV